MTTQQQAYMLFLSDELLKGMWVPNMVQNESALRARAAQELRRLHAENEQLRAGYDAARLEIASLRERVQQLGQLARDVNSRRVTELEAQLAAVGAGGVEPLRKRECLHQISEPAQAMLAHFLEKEAPRIDAAGLDAERHCCEHTLYLERERLHAAIAAQKENHD